MAVVVEMSGSTAVAVLGIAGTLIANAIAVVRVFYKIELRLAVIDTRMRHVEKKLGVTAHQEAADLVA